MAGFFIRDLKLRSFAERAFVVCPANLTFQWWREHGKLSIPLCADMVLLGFS